MKKPQKRLLAEFISSSPPELDSPRAADVVALREKHLREQNNRRLSYHLVNAFVVLFHHLTQKTFENDPDFTVHAFGGDGKNPLQIVFIPAATTEAGLIIDKSYNVALDAELSVFFDTIETISDGMNISLEKREMFYRVATEDPLVLISVLSALVERSKSLTLDDIPPNRHPATMSFKTAASLFRERAAKTKRSLSDIAEECLAALKPDIYESPDAAYVNGEFTRRDINEKPIAQISILRLHALASEATGKDFSPETSGYRLH